MLPLVTITIHDFSQSLTFTHLLNSFKRLCKYRMWVKLSQKYAYSSTEDKIIGLKKIIKYDVNRSKNNL